MFLNIKTKQNSSSRIIAPANLIINDYFKMKIPSNALSETQIRPSVFIKPLKMSLEVNISEPDEFNCSELHGCIKEFALLKGVEDFTYHVDFVCGKGENYIANIFRVIIKECGNDDKNFSAIVKTLINTTRQELFYELHKREVIAYELVIKRYVDLQESISVDERVIFPDCLLTKIEKGNEIIIFEDLKVKGFEVDKKLSKYDRLDYSQARAVLKNLAKFHALTFIYEKRDEVIFAKLKADFQDIIFSNKFLNKTKLRNYFEDSYETSLHLVENLVAKKKLKSVVPKLLEVLQNYTSPKEGKINVFCHGDCWINNVMFENHDAEETKVCFIDFQTMRYANLATDILHFIYLCTDSAFRSAYFEDLLNEYHDSLKSFLKLFDIEVNSVCYKEDFITNVEEMKPYGLLLALIELKLVTTTPEDDAILKGSTLVLNTDNTKVPGEDEYYKIRVNDVVEESVENGVLYKLIQKIKAN